MYKNIIKARKKGKCILYSSISRISYWTPMLVTINPCVLVCDYFCTVTRIPIQRQRLEYTKPCSRTDRDKQTIQRCASRATEKPCHSDGVSMGFILNASPCTRAWVRNASGASEGSSHGDPWVRVRNRGWSWPKPRASATALTGLPWPECTPRDGEVPLRETQRQCAQSWLGCSWLSGQQSGPGPSSFREASHCQRQSTPAGNGSQNKCNFVSKPAVNILKKNKWQSGGHQLK